MSQSPNRGGSFEMNPLTPGSSSDRVPLTTCIVETSNVGTERYKRRLFLALTLFTILIAIINILQFALLGSTQNHTWMIVVPVVLFAGFLAYLSFYCFQHQQDFLKALSGPWYRRSARMGVILTVLLNIIFCEFVYFNIVVLKDFNQFAWDTQIDAPTNVPAPSLALIQVEDNRKRAILEKNATALEDLCQAKLKATPPNQGCFTTWKTYASKLYGTLNYVTFDGSTYKKNLDMTNDLDIAYLFNYNGPDRPSLGYAVFDSNLVSDFETALDCGVIGWNNFPPLARNQISLEQSVINDDVKAINRDSSCEKFTDYKFYRGVMTQTGVDIPNINKCDISTSDPGKTPCTGDIDLYFSSLLITSYKSKRGTSWLKFFTDEGSIDGGIGFITWFFTIFGQ